MAGNDRERWNARYRAGSNLAVDPNPYLVAVADRLPAAETEPSRALDVAGGAGRNALWLAARGYRVTIVDVSEVGLAIAGQRADERGLSLTTVCADLEREPIPAGPWDVIVSCHFLRRELLPAYAAALRPGGMLVFVQATVTNLERHARPPRRFLLDRGELSALVKPIVDLEVIDLKETWTEDGHHQAQLLARRTATWCFEQALRAKRG